jgi:hypothetical protein
MRPRFGSLAEKRIKLPYLVAISLVFVFYLYLAGSVDNELESTDIAAIKMLRVESTCLKKADFQSEILCIKSIQLAIQSLVPNRGCAAKGVRIEPLDFVQRGYGCCYDRARFMEKSLRFYGFKTRHVAIFDTSRFGLWSLLVPGIPSHATSEVFTTRGWMGVDSNEMFILMSKGQDPLTYKDYKDEQLYTLAPVSFYSNDKLFVIYGLYSRHGMFHGLNLPAPEFNLAELVYNF